MLRIVVVVALVSSTSIARADPAATRAAMEDYFAGEKRGGLVLIGMGTVGIAGGTTLYLSDGARARGASYVLGGIGVLHLAAGIFVYGASSVRMRAYDKAIDADAARFAAVEGRRMKGVSLQFTILKIVEVAGIAGGVTMAVIGNRSDRPRLEGAGYALAGEMAATLVFDIVAARRASRYRSRLATSVSTSIDPESGMPMLVVAGTF